MRHAFALMVPMVLLAGSLHANPCSSGHPGTPRLVCVDRATLVATPDPITVKAGRKVNVWFSDGKGKIQIDWMTAPMKNKGRSGANAWATAKLTGSGTHQYAIYDESKGVGADPTIIIEPIAPLPIKPRRRLAKE